jgi:hypothetical protein
MPVLRPHPLSFLPMLCHSEERSDEESRFVWPKNPDPSFSLIPYNSVILSGGGGREANGGGVEGPQGCLSPNEGSGNSRDLRRRQDGNTLPL